MIRAALILAALAAAPWHNGGWSADPSSLDASPPLPTARIVATPPPAAVAEKPTVEPSGPPTPILDAEGWPSDRRAAVARALAAINARRRERNAGPLVLDDCLSEAAQDLADRLESGQARPHEGFPERVRSRGWPFQTCGIRNVGFGNVTEGIAWGGETPEECVLILDGSPNPHEGHRRDFEDPALTHVGIGLARDRRYGHVAVVDYGAQCSRPAPAASAVAAPPPRPLNAAPAPAPIPAARASPRAVMPPAFPARP